MIKLRNWKNDMMTYNRACEIANQLNDNAIKAGIMKIEGILAMSVATTNHPDFTFERVQQTRAKDFNFTRFESEIVPDFKKEYKRKLFEFLQQECF
jgi:metal-sulfur cluster biosynthetic enzyme